MKKSTRKIHQRMSSPMSSVIKIKVASRGIILSIFRIMYVMIYFLEQRITIQIVIYLLSMLFSLCPITNVSV